MILEPPAMEEANPSSPGKFRQAQLKQRDKKCKRQRQLRGAFYGRIASLLAAHRSLHRALSEACIVDYFNSINSGQFGISSLSPPRVRGAGGILCRLCVL